MWSCCRRYKVNPIQRVPLLDSLKIVLCVLQSLPSCRKTGQNMNKVHRQGLHKDSFYKLRYIRPSAFSSVHCANHISLLLVNDVVHLSLRGDGVLSLGEELIAIHYVLKFFVINTYALNVGALGA